MALLCFPFRRIILTMSSYSANPCLYTSSGESAAATSAASAPRPQPCQLLPTYLAQPVHPARAATCLSSESFHDVRQKERQSVSRGVPKSSDGRADSIKSLWKLKQEAMNIDFALLPAAQKQDYSLPPLNDFDSFDDSASFDYAASLDSADSFDYAASLDSPDSFDSADSFHSPDSLVNVELDNAASFDFAASLESADFLDCAASFDSVASFDSAVGSMRSRKSCPNFGATRPKLKLILSR